MDSPTHPTTAITTAQERRRATHKKSRNGCLPCKQRHTKCDETRPRCVNCTVAGRACQYAGAASDDQAALSPAARRRRQAQTHSQAPAPSSQPQPPPHTLATTAPQSPLPGIIPSTSPVGTPKTVDTHPFPQSAVPPGNPYASPASHATSPAASTPVAATPHGSAHSVTSNASPVATSVPASRTSTIPHILNPPDPAPKPAQSDPIDSVPDLEVNMTHMELLINFSSTTAIPELDGYLIEEGTRYIFAKALIAPCVLYEVLAISARSLSVHRPARYDFYYRLAMQLQTRAINLFREMVSSDRSNRDSMLVFSSILHRHLLTDTLATTRAMDTGDDLRVFLDRFVELKQLANARQSAITTNNWPALVEADWAPFLAWGIPFPTHTPTFGNECETLRRLVAISTTLDPLAREACRSAIHLIQRGFDDLASPPEGKNKYHMLFSWWSHLPAEFYQLIRQYRPEAAAIMAWYAVLLDRGQHLWQIRDTGLFLFRSAAAFLGPDWTHWLDWPRAVFEDRLRGLEQIRIKPER